MKKFQERFEECSSIREEEERTVDGEHITYLDAHWEENGTRILAGQAWLTEYLSGTDEVDCSVGFGEDNNDKQLMVRFPSYEKAKDFADGFLKACLVAAAGKIVQ